MSIAIKRNFIIPSTSAIGASELYLTSNTGSTTSSTGALTVVGGAGFGKTVSIGGNLGLFNGSFYTAFKSSATSNKVYILPDTTPSTGTSVLQSDSSGNMKWVSMSSGSISDINGITLGTQYFATIISGSGFTISSTGSTHTFVLALAGNATTGLISATSQTIYGTKTFNDGLIGTLTGTASSSAYINIDSTSSTRYILGTVLNSASGSTQISTGSGITIGNNLLTSGAIAITNTTNSTTVSSGSLVVSGGVGVGASLSVGGRLQIFNGSNYTAFASSASGNTVYTLPPTTPATGTSFLQSNASGTMSWTSAGSFSSVTITGSATFSGNISITQTTEKFNNYTTNIGSGTTVTLSSDTAGNLIYVNTGTVSGNWTIDVTNLNLTTGFSTAVTVIIAQGSTAYMPTIFRIGSVTQTIIWQGGGSVPTGNANKTDILIYSILCTASNTYTVFGQLVTFG